uniref:BTB domain-containing protein n=1 Tax=Rhabditophanes sp. KR3021 TaxID=114890 RepID=A0AC35UFF4_9BILA
MLFRKLEKILNVHPEKYKARSEVHSRRSTPLQNDLKSNQLYVRSASEEFRKRSLPSGSSENSFHESVSEKMLEDISVPIPTELNSMTCHENGNYWHHSEQFSDIITINVSGKKFQTYESTLAKIPNSLLGHPVKRSRFWNQKIGEFFVDRPRECFESILNIYQRDEVRRPENISLEIYLRELKFFEMGDEVLEKYWMSEGYEKPKEHEMPNTYIQRVVWELMEYPDSSVAARVIAFTSIIVIIISIASFCLETLPDLKDFVDTLTNQGASIWQNPFLILESFCIFWFAGELILRFLSCPSKIAFVKSFLNIIDFVAIAPFFINLFLYEGSKSNSSMSFAVLRVLRLVRVFRVFKLSRHSVGLQILGKTFKASTQEFCLLIFFMSIAMILFASGIYFAEQGEVDTKFTSIPASFYPIIITLTTVGFGDVTPTGTYGRIVVSCCSLIGVLTLALPVPIIVANFKHFYRQEIRLALMRQSRELEDAPSYGHSPDDFDE